GTFPLRLFFRQFSRLQHSPSLPWLKTTRVNTAAIVLLTQKLLGCIFRHAEGSGRLRILTELCKCRRVIAEVLLKRRYPVPVWRDGPIEVRGADWDPRFGTL